MSNCCWPKKLSLQFFNQAGQARIVRAQPCHPLGIRECGRDVPVLATNVDSSRKQVEIIRIAAQALLDNRERFVGAAAELSPMA